MENSVSYDPVNPLPADQFFSFFSGVTLFIFLAIAIVALVLKGMALWRAARNGSKGWFIALLIVNTGGVLELLYLFVFGKKSGISSSQPMQSSPPAGQDPTLAAASS